MCLLCDVVNVGLGDFAKTITKNLNISLSNPVKYFRYHEKLKPKLLNVDTVVPATSGHLRFGEKMAPRDMWPPDTGTLTRHRQ